MTTARFVSVRLLQSVALVLLIHVALFFVISVLPGDPISNRLSDPASGYTPAQIERLQDYYGLNRPVHEQLLSGLGALLHGDLGLSLASNRSVTSMIAEVLPSTLGLTAAAFVLAVLIAVVVAGTASFAPWSWLRGGAAAVPPLFLSVPGFLVGMVLIQVLSFQLGWFQALRDEGLKAVLLPALTLAVPASAPIAQVLLVSLRRTQEELFVTVARAKGLTAGALVRSHVARPSSLPAVTMAAVCIAELLGGAVIVEAVFARQGVGSLVERAVVDQDLPVLQAVVLLASVACVSANLVVDLVQPLIDPRLRTARA